LAFDSTFCHRPSVQACRRIHATVVARKLKAARLVSFFVLIIGQSKVGLTRGHFIYHVGLSILPTGVPPHSRHCRRSQAQNGGPRVFCGFNDRKLEGRVNPRAFYISCLSIFPTGVPPHSRHCRGSQAQNGGPSGLLGHAAPEHGECRRSLNGYATAARNAPARGVTPQQQVSDNYVSQSTYVPKYRSRCMYHACAHRPSVGRHPATAGERQL